MSLTPVAGQMWAQTIYSYKVELMIRPAVVGVNSDQASAATRGEVVVQMPGLPKSEMAAVDQGLPTNRHLDVRLYNRTTNTLINTIPTISITDSDGSTRQITVIAMYRIGTGAWDLHFGNNIYLPDGRYTITVLVGSERAVFGVTVLPG